MEAFSIVAERQAKCMAKLKFNFKVKIIRGNGRYI